MNQPIDYQAALDDYRREEHRPVAPVHSGNSRLSPPLIDGFVDYLAVTKAWEKEQEGLYKIRMKAGKRNPSHDPVR